jgi:hypothetical protein
VKSLVLSILILLLVAIPTIGRQDDPVRCVITLYDLRGEDWKLIKSVKFEPKMGEEELTNQRVRLTRTGLFLFASVFPTDESMASAKGVDSIKLGLGMSRKRGANAFELANNAVAEGTLSTMDTLRVERAAYVNRKLMLTRLECWDPNLETDK